MRRSIDQSISPISRLTVIETIIDNDRLNLEINPARERHAVFRKIDRFLRRIELNHNCIYDLVFDQAWHRCHVIGAQDSLWFTRYKLRIKIIREDHR